MKGCYMSQPEITRLQVMERLLNKNIKQKQAAKLLNLSVRQIKRLLKRYKQTGAKGLIHRARGKQSNNQIPQAEIDRVIQIVKENYPNCGPTFTYEKLVADNQVHFSLERLRQAMIETGLWQARQRKKVKVHQLRNRRACAGELVQIDGSPHAWFENRGPRCNLNVMIDDATGKILARFSPSETTQDYFQLLEQYIYLYGIPLALYSDRHAIFTLNREMKQNLNHLKPSIKDKDWLLGLTQFGRACQELGIKLILANSPQSKGRVERVNRTLQDRLVKELRLRQINTIDQANLFLPEFLEEFNHQFAVPPRSKVNMHQPLSISKDQLKQILSVKHHRLLSRNLTCQYNKTIYQIQTKRSPLALRGTQVTICQRYDGETVILDKHGQPLAYTIAQTIQRPTIATSKQINHLVDAILIQQAKRNFKRSGPFDSTWEELNNPHR